MAYSSLTRSMRSHCMSLKCVQSPVSSASSPQPFWDPCIFCHRTSSLEFPAWSSARSSCWLGTTDLYKVPDALPPIHAESYHVATDNGPSIDGGKFRSIFSDNLQPIATRIKKARGALLVDIGCSSKGAPLSVSYYNEISGGHIGSSVVRTRGSACARNSTWRCICSPDIRSVSKH